MASPQKENGYTAIANEIMEALARYRIPGEKRQVLDCIFRNTYGFSNRKEAQLSNNDIAKSTGLKRVNVIRSIRWLVSKRILLSIKKDTNGRNILKFNKDYDDWCAFEKRHVGIKKDTKGSIKKDTKSDFTPIIVKTKKQGSNLSDSAKIVLDRINALSGKNFTDYKPILKVLQSKAFTHQITIDECISVVEFKWKDEFIREKYFTPASLFRITKFESKLDEAKNDKPVKSQQHPQIIRAGDERILSNG